MAAAWRRCFNMALKEDVHLPGSVRITARIGPAGDVISAETAVQGLSVALVECVVARVRDARFMPPEGGAATIVIPINFVTKG